MNARCQEARQGTRRLQKARTERAQALDTLTYLSSLAWNRFSISPIAEAFLGEIFASTWERPNGLRFNLKGGEPKTMNKQISHA